MSVPFDEKDFRKEIKGKTLFGVISGLSLMPLVISEGQKMPDLNEPGLEEFLNKFNNLVMNGMNEGSLLRSRFLSIVDEILEKGICDEVES